MSEFEESELRIQAVKHLLHQEDIDRLYASDQATFEQIKSIADTQIPPEVDEAVSTFLAEFDIDIAGADPVVKPVLRILFQASRVKGWKLKQRVLATKVREWIVRVPTASLEMGTPSPSIYKSSCHECGTKFDEKRYICPNCWALIIKPP